MVVAALFEIAIWLAALCAIISSRGWGALVFVGPVRYGGSRSACQP